jgi:hypothetical protein
MTSRQRFVISFFAVVLIFTLVFSPLEAESTVIVNLYVRPDAVASGDTIAVNVNFQTFPHLTRYGPIEVQFDPAYVSFEGAEKGSAMPSTFAVSNTASTSVVAVSGLDQTVEGLIASHKTTPAATTAEGTEPTDAPYDPSMYSEETVTVCILYFKIKETAPAGEARFLIGNLSGFRDSTGAQLTATAGTSATVSIDSLLSSNTSLSALSIEGAIFSKDFLPSIYEYEVHVPKSVSDVAISATATDSDAIITISGGNHLLVGENLAVVRVVAEDGITSSEYRIHIFRDATYVPPGSFITDEAGKIYLFAELPETLSLPVGFVQELQTIGTQTVPVFVRAGIRSMVIYLKDSDKDPALYVYDPYSGIIRPFDVNSVLTQPGQLFMVTMLPVGISIPKGFSEGTVQAGEWSLPGYISADQKTSLLYLTNESGQSRFYVVDESTGDVYPYQVKNEESNSYLIPFILVSVFALAEMGMIAYIIVEVRSKNRPKEVRRV